ncbi:MAG: 16S rRNA (uracil(1498)-N(3))-methyltransferase [Desulfobacterales bacterium]|nr:16S rRNA (uracil(1498)-N(3))-methyltransferase [Desulfobacterales bacterium]
MRRFFIQKENISENRGLIQGDEARHMIQVLRLKAGDQVILLDGEGGEYLAILSEVQEKTVYLTLTPTTTEKRADLPAITVCQAFLKEKKMDEMVRPLTELGMARFQAFFSQRVVARPKGEKLEKRKGRWEKIAMEAMKQCGRASAPEISKAIEMRELLKQLPSGESILKLLFWEEAQVSFKEIEAMKLNEKGLSDIFLMIGPEGGFTQEEAELAKENGFFIAGLGCRILRAETAPITALSLTQYLFGDL